jgi:hypothetical protein
MIGISSGWYKITLVAQRIDSFVYKPWITYLNPENPVLKIHAENFMYWCGKFEDCKTE